MELQPNEIAISKQEYNTLLQNNAKIESLEKKIADLEQETKNKWTALQEARSKAKEEKENYAKELESKTEEINNIKTMLWLSQEDPINDKLAEVLTWFESYKEVLQKEQETRTANIENYKKSLWEEFLNSKADLLSWLDDKKTEAILKEFFEQRQPKDKKVELWIHNNWWSIEDKKSDFEKAVSSWASSEDLLNAMINM